MNTAAIRDIRLQYATDGYAVIPRLIPAERCVRAMDAFCREIKPYRGFLYRQATAAAERHTLDSHGHVLNSLLNPVAVRERCFPFFRRAMTDILASDFLFDLIESVLGEPATQVQSMYFEGNPATWPHQDSYYLDGERIGSMVAAWIALEDIDERAGRFYVGPQSHRINVANNSGSLESAFHHDRYKALMRRLIENRQIKLAAPALKRGDVLIWNSLTIHGAHEPVDRAFSRNSLTAHFIPSSMKFLQLQSLVKRLRPARINGHSVFIPKDQNCAANRFMLNAEAWFPGPFRWFKKNAVRLAIAGKTRDRSAG